MRWLIPVTCLVSSLIQHSGGLDKSAVQGNPRDSIENDQESTDNKPVVPVFRTEIHPGDSLLRSDGHELFFEGRLPIRDAVEGRPDPILAKTQMLGPEDLADFVMMSQVLEEEPVNRGQFYRGAVEAAPDNYRFFKNMPFSPENSHLYDDRVSFRTEIDPEIDSTDLIRTNEKSGVEPYKVICYWGAWSIYRPSPMDFGPGDFEPTGCTHIIYSFTGLDNDTLTLVSLDPDYDTIQGGYRAVIRLKKKNPNLKVMIAVGGWNEGGKKYSKMASSKDSRRRFIDSVLEFLEKYGFDGFDLDWEYPGASDRQGVWADKENFARLVEEMSAEFKPRGLLLSAAVSAAIFRVNEGYDVPRISAGLDFINVMTYDLHGSWDRYADHHSPIRRRPFDDWATANLHGDGALSYWIKSGAPAEKVIYGIPFYGRSFTLGSTQNTQPKASIKGPGKPGKYTREEGFLAYYEICEEIALGGWTEMKDPVNSPYAFKGDQWVGYDTPEYIEEKMKYVIEKGLGGAMIWAIDLDDYRGICGEKWPLLKAMNRGLGIGFTATAAPPVPEPSPAPVEPEPQPEPSVAPVQPEPQTEAPPQPEAPAPQTEAPTPVPSAAPQPTAAPIVPPSTTLAPVTTKAPVVEPQPDAVDCGEDGNGYFRDPSDCSVFYQCAHGVKYMQTCPGGLHFDTQLSICNWPEAVNCNPVEGASQEDFVCEEDGLFNDPKDCSGYYWCANGLKYKMSCGTILHFDASLGVCNYPDLANCNPGVKVLVKSLAHDDERHPALRAGTDKKLLCYITSWSWTRSGEGSFVPENVDPFLCTHIVYAYAALDPEFLVIRPGDKWTDVDNKMYERVVALKERNPDLKVLLGLGGWADSGDDKYSRLVSSAEARSKFGTHAAAFLKIYGFDGLHIDWQYPKCWNLDCSKGPDSDAAGYGRLARELRTVFSGVDLILSASLSASPAVIDVAYDVEALSESLDMITVMSYDYHGPWENKTGYIAPSRSGDGNDVESTMRFLEHKGFPRNKLLVGLPTYGRSFTLVKPNDASLTKGSGSPAPLTKEPGLMAYYEICFAAKILDWSQGKTKSGAFITRESEWVGYDGPDAFGDKAQFIVAAGYAGAAVWSLDLDDFSNRCCEESFRLTRAVARGLGLRSDSYAKSCDKPQVVTPAPVNFTTDWNEGLYSPTRPVPTLLPTTKKPTGTTTAAPATAAPSTTQPATAPPTTTAAPTTTKQPTTAAPTTAPPTTKPPTTTTTTTTTTTAAPTTSTTRTTTRPTTTTTRTTTRATTTVAPSPGGLINCEFGKYYPDPSGSCESFAICLGDYWVVQQCAAGLMWNAAGVYCDYPESVVCGGGSQMSPGGSVDSGTSGNQQVSAVGPVDPDSMMKEGPCDAGSMVAMPGNCNQYQLCDHGRYLPMTCPPGLHWNTQNNICDWPASAACTAEQASTAAPPAPSPVTTKATTTQAPQPSTTKAPPPPTTAAPASTAAPPAPTSTAAPPSTVTTKPAASTTAPVVTTTAAQTTLAPVTVPVVTTKAPTSATSTEPPKPTGDSQMKVICYFTNWAWYRPGEGKYTPDNIDTTLCTHIVYGFATLDYSNLVMKPYDTWADLDNKFYSKVVALKQKGVHVSIALGGWNDSAGDKYSRLVNNPEARKKFVDNAIIFLEKYGFEGLDLDWEYPKCWQVDCSKGPNSDKENFALWVKEISDAFKPRGWTVSAAVSPSRTVIDAGYDVAMVNKYLDWVGVMTYDYYGNWDKKTGHVSPLYHFPESDFDYFNTNYTINYWLQQGATKDKLTAGVPLYGQAFTLRDPKVNGMNAPATNPGQAGEFTRQAGFLAYYEICHRINVKGGWTVVQDEQHRYGPYAYNKNQWVSFDDAAQIERKGRLFREWGLAGVIVWAPDLDDFRNRCGCEPHPLLRALNRGLGRIQEPGPDCTLTSKPYVEPEPTPGGGTGTGGTGFGGTGGTSGACDEGSTVRDPTDCNKYKLCNHGSYIDQYCPAGLYWSGSGCDWPANTDCKPGTKPPVVAETQKPKPAPAPVPTFKPITTLKPAPAPIAPAPAPTPKPLPAPVPTLKPVPSSTAVTTRVPGPSTERPPTKDTGYKVICYFTNWAWYRPGDGKYTPSHIDESLCTHIVYGFATLDPNQLTMKVYDSWADLDNNFYKRVVALQEKGVRVSVALGGWNDSLGNKYSRLVNNPEARARFVKHAVDFVQKYGFDGLDLDWEYPKCWQVNCAAGPDSDKDGFSAWIKELSAEFKPRGWTLSAAVSPSKTVIDAGYDVKVLSDYLDWIGVMTYDYHGQWDKKTGHVSPLFYHPEDDIDYFNTNYTIHYWKEQGADPAKLTMGVPLYGQAFTLADTKNNGLNAKAPGAGNAGEFTRQAGFLAYYEICDRIRKGGWTVVQDPEGRMGPYAYKASQWVSFDDAAMIKRKAQMLKEWNIAGVIVWAPDLDDFKNRCGCEPHPLLRALNRGLGRLETPDPMCEV